MHLLRKSLSAKILTTLSISVAAVMIVIVCFAISAEIKQMLNAMHVSTEEMTTAIHTGIKYPMSIGDSLAVERQLIQIRETLKDVQVFICNPELKIIFACHEGMLGKDLNEYIQDAGIVQKVSLALKDVSSRDLWVEGEDSKGRYIVHAHAIENQPECFACHGAGKKVLGAIILKKSTNEDYAAITDYLSFLGIGSIVFIVYTMLHRLVSRPVKNLASDMMALPEKISSKDAIAVPDVDRTDEIGVLQDSFYSMAIQLDEKNRAVEAASLELARANKDLEAFAYSVSHDLRAPLRNIDGFSKILLDDFSDEIDEKGKHYLSRVREGTVRMSTLIDDMLTFSRIGRSELSFVRTDCRKILNRILNQHAQEMSERKISVELEELPLLRCDSALVESLFTNLISNALKFTRDIEKPEIRIGYDRDKAAIYVSDNGIGFDMQYHDKIFEVFHRLHLPEEYKGTGIGLAIVRRIAERHKGKVWAESEPNKGTTFFIQLPVYKEE
jgi:signal transduction histidine kinase